MSAAPHWMEFNFYSRLALVFWLVNWQVAPFVMASSLLADRIGTKNGKLASVAVGGAAYIWYREGTHCRMEQDMIDRLGVATTSSASAPFRIGSRPIHDMPIHRHMRYFFFSKEYIFPAHQTCQFTILSFPALYSHSYPMNRTSFLPLGSASFRDNSTCSPNILHLTWCL